MLGVDTNLLVRLVTRDDEKQALVARRELLKAAAAGERLRVDAIVLCELVWVLRSGYDHSREQIGEVLQALIDTPEIVVEDADLARRALKDYMEGRGGFADAFMAHRNERSTCDVTLTFDKRLARNRLFRVL